MTTQKTRNLQTLSESRNGFLGKYGFLAITVMAILAGCSHEPVLQKYSANVSDPIADQVGKTQKAHGLEAWWGKEVMQADVMINFGGKIAVDGAFIFEAHGPRARFDKKDGTSVIFDGKTAWVTPGDKQAPMGRFHVLTWPWFIMAPFKMEGAGITLSEYEQMQFDGGDYVAMKQSFASDMGDAPEDWYRFFINQENDQIDAMAYIVTYGSSAEEGNKKPSVIDYLDYENFAGTWISTRYELWYWDESTYTRVGDAPKAFGTVSNVRYHASSKNFFEVPQGAKELKLP